MIVLMSHHNTTVSLPFLVNLVMSSVTDSNGVVIRRDSRPLEKDHEETLADTVVRQQARQQLERSIDQREE